MVIMLAMHVSFSILEAWHACTASSMSSTGCGLSWVGGGSSFFVGLKLVLEQKAKMSLPFGYKRGSWWLGHSRAIVWPIEHRAFSTFPSWHRFLLGVIILVHSLWANAAK